MFLGRQLKQSAPLTLQASFKQFALIQITNAALSISSNEAQLYIKLQDQQILICELNRKLGILQTSLNILIDLKNHPQLISKNGNINVCGYYQIHQNNFIQNKILNSEAEINTNKKDNSLQAKFQKAQTLQAETYQIQQKNSSTNKQKQIINSETSLNQRQSSRLSMRRTSNLVTQKEPQKQKQKQSKKQQKSSKKQEKSNSMLNNGRYSLKALLQNASNDSDDDSESDEDFSNQGQQQQSDEDQSSDEGQEQEEQTHNKKIKQNGEQLRSSKRCKPQEGIQQKSIHKKVQQKTMQQQLKQTFENKNIQQQHTTNIEIVQQDQDFKKSPNTQQFQEKWPQIQQSSIEKQSNKRQQIIEELASKMKVPTKKPTI